MLFPTRVPPKAKTQGRVDFDMDKFRVLMEQKGVEVSWIQTITCPCSQPSSEAGMDLFNVTDEVTGLDHAPTCTTCKGSGFIRYDAQDIKILFQRNAGSNDISDYGTSLNAGAGVTLLPEHLPSFGDRFRILNSAIVRSEKITASAGQFIYDLSYNVTERELDLDPAPQTVSALEIYINDATGQNAFLLDPSNYSIDVANNQIRFLSGLPGVNLPADQHEFSIKYYAHPEFVVTSHPYIIRDTKTLIKGVEKNQPLPVRCVVRLENT